MSPLPPPPEGEYTGVNTRRRGSLELAVISKIYCLIWKTFKHIQQQRKEYDELM